jgi:ABC-type glutathione transport system ATPase component
MSSEAVGLVGESGAGKTSRRLPSAECCRQTRGSNRARLFLRSKELVGLPEREFRKIRGAEIALISHEPAAALNPVLCAEDQIAEVLRAHGAGMRARRRPYGTS